jgi:hypothetical protein
LSQIQKAYEDKRTLESIRKKIVECETELAVLNFKNHYVSEYLTVELNTIREHIDFDLIDIIPKKGK